MVCDSYLYCLTLFADGKAICHLSWENVRRTSQYPCIIIIDLHSFPYFCLCHSWVLLTNKFIRHVNFKVIAYLLTHKSIVSVTDSWHASLSRFVHDLVHHLRHNLYRSYFVSISLNQSLIAFKVIISLRAARIAFVFNSRLWDFSMTVALLVRRHR